MSEVGSTKNASLALCYKLLKYFDKKMERGVFVISQSSEQDNPICNELFSVLDIPFIKDDKEDQPNTLKIGKFANETFVLLPDCILKLNTDEKKIILYFLICSFVECRFLFVVTHYEVYNVGLARIKDLFQRITSTFSDNSLCLSMGFFVSNPKEGFESSNYLCQLFGPLGFQKQGFHIKERKQETLKIVKKVFEEKRLLALDKHHKQETRTQFETMFGSLAWFKLDIQASFYKIFSEAVVMNQPWISSLRNIQNKLLESFRGKTQRYIHSPQQFSFESKTDGSAPANVAVVNMLGLFISLTDLILVKDADQEMKSLKHKYKLLISLLKQNQVLPPDQILLTGYQELWERLYFLGQKVFFIDFVSIEGVFYNHFSCNESFQNMLYSLLSLSFESIDHYTGEEKSLQLAVINTLKRHLESLQSMMQNPGYLKEMPMFSDERTQRKVAKCKAKLDFFALKQHQSLTHFRHFFQSASRAPLIENDLIKSAYNLLAQYLYHHRMFEEAILCYKKGHHQSSAFKIIKIYQEGFELNIHSLQLFSKKQFVTNIHRLEQYASELLFYGKKEVLQDFIYCCLELSETFSLGRDIKEKFQKMLFRMFSSRNHESIVSVLTRKSLDQKVEIEEAFLLAIWSKLKAHREE